MIRPMIALFAATLLGGLTLTSSSAVSSPSKATLVLKNDAHSDTMSCSLYHVSHWSNGRKKKLKQFRVSPRQTVTRQVTLPTRPLAKSKKVKTLPNPNYKPKLQLHCKLGSNKNHWKWGPIWSTASKPVNQWRQESICRDGSPCGVFFEEIDSL